MDDDSTCEFTKADGTRCRGTRTKDSKGDKTKFCHSHKGAKVTCSRCDNLVEKGVGLCYACADQPQQDQEISQEPPDKDVKTGIDPDVNPYALGAVQNQLETRQAIKAVRDTARNLKESNQALKRQNRNLKAGWDTVSQMSTDTVSGIWKISKDLQQPESDDDDEQYLHSTKNSKEYLVSLAKQMMPIDVDDDWC